MDDNARDINISVFVQSNGFGSITDFDVNDLENLASWCGPIEGSLRARALSASINAHSSPELVTSCAQSIASLEQWRELLVDLIRTSEITPPTVDVARQVLRDTMPSHPLAKLECSPVQATGIYDAIGDGERLTFILDSMPVESQQWIFFDVANPLELATHASVTIEDGRVSVRLDELAWIDPQRAACPAFAAVTV